MVHPGRKASGSVGVKNFKLFEERSDNVFEIQTDDRMTPKDGPASEAETHLARRYRNF